MTARKEIMNLTLGQLNRMDQLAAEWSFLWDKRRSLWIAAEDCVDGEQIEEIDLDVLLDRVELAMRLSALRSAGTTPLPESVNAR